MPEDESLERYLAKIRQLHHLGLGQRNQRITELEQTVDQLQKQLAERDRQLTEQKTQIADLQETTKYTTTWDFVTHPTILARANNTIQFVNERLVEVSHRDPSELMNRPLTDFFQGLEFLDQIRSDPLLMQVEDLDALAHVPVVLMGRQGEEIFRSAEINFLPPQRAYNGVKLTLKPKEERTLVQKTRQHLPRYLGGVSKYDGLDAKDYTQDHRLVVRDKQAEQPTPQDGTTLLTEITRRVLELDNYTYHRRRVVVNFRTIESCDPRFYQTLLAISQMKGLPLACIVSEDSEPYQELIKTGFPEKNIVIERKKEKKK
ncbi:MAG: hypothetical protein Q8L34_06015 [Candidatus Woesearchaeota archaeon]|nr:hypothetical protein [Candidatus Woesearchaeota archaeon]